MFNINSCGSSPWQHQPVVHSLNGYYDSSGNKQPSHCFRNSSLTNYVHFPGPKVFQPVVLFNEDKKNSKHVHNEKDVGWKSDNLLTNSSVSLPVSCGNDSLIGNQVNIRARKKNTETTLNSLAYDSKADCFPEKQTNSAITLENDAKEIEKICLEHVASEDAPSEQACTGLCESVATPCSDNEKCLEHKGLQSFPNCKQCVIERNNFLPYTQTVSSFQQHTDRLSSYRPLRDTVNSNKPTESSFYRGMPCHNDIQYSVLSTNFPPWSFPSGNYWSATNALQKQNFDFPFTHSSRNNHVWNINHKHLMSENSYPRTSVLVSCSPDNSFLNGHKSAFKTVRSSTSGLDIPQSDGFTSAWGLTFVKDVTNRRADNNHSLHTGDRNGRVASAERPFKCDCSRTFARNEELTRHRRIHSGYKPHRCHICDKLFGRKDHLNKHLKTHLRTSEKKTHMCAAVPGCRQSYTRSDALTRHQWTAHGIPPKTSKWSPRKLAQSQGTEVLETK